MKHNQAEEKVRVTFWPYGSTARSWKVKFPNQSLQDYQFTADKTSAEIKAMIEKNHPEYEAVNLY